MIDIKYQLKKIGIEPDLLRDQFFLEDENIIGKIIDLSDLNKSDVVLEIGAGVGNLTRELAKKAGKVISFEVDDRLGSLLQNLPGNVEIHFEDAHEFVSQGGKFRHKKEYNKVVSNIPYSVGEWLLHNLAFIDYDKTILLVAKRFAKSTKKNPVFSSFYKIEEKFKVAKEKFYPIPKSDSVVIDLIKLREPIETKDMALYLRQFIYAHEGWKVKNSLREGLIKYYQLVYSKRLTKNEAREVIRKKEFNKKLLEDYPREEIYSEISSRF